MVWIWLSPCIPHLYNELRRAWALSPLALWQLPRRELVDEVIRRGCTARIAVVRNEKMSPDFLGRMIDRQPVHELEVLGVDAGGENGEVHTVVTGGSLFFKALQVYGVEKLVVADCTLLRIELGNR